MINSLRYYVISVLTQFFFEGILIKIQQQEEESMTPPSLLRHNLTPTRIRGGRYIGYSLYRLGGQKVQSSYFQAKIFFHPY